MMPPRHGGGVVDGDVPGTGFDALHVVLTVATGLIIMIIYLQCGGEFDPTNAVAWLQECGW